jgi:cytochrome c peroxidase
VNRIKYCLWTIALLIVAGVAAASSYSVLATSTRLDRSVSIDEAADTDGNIDEPIVPIPRHIELDARKVSLGRRLFHDPRLSADNSISCASCHDLRHGGIDGRATSVGISGGIGDVNAPTVFNSGFNFRQFWDGRAETLEDQIEGPIHNPAEMRSDWPEILQKLSKDPEYARAFSAIYSTGIQSHTIKDAIATFERSLLTIDCRFDRYLRGDDKALTSEEKEGYRLFKGGGCSSCHQGVLAGGNMYEKLGIVADYFGDRGKVVKADQGRFNVTGRESDRYKFKVPSLRNVERTAPYFHDGSTKTLEQAVSVMAEYQLGRQFSSEEIRLVVLFLKTLTGEYQEKSQ